MAKTFLFVILLLLLVLGSQESLVSYKLALLSALSNKAPTAQELEALRSENVALRAALQERKKFEQVFPDFTRQGIVVGAYSSYPFNFKHIITLAGGRDHGIKKGGAAVFHGVLVGQVTEVLSKTSILKTIFDPRWEIAVRIGAQGVDAVAHGGSEPTLTLIAKDSDIKTGDFVFSADPALPLGLVLGEICEVRDQPSAVFKEAKLCLPYTLQSLHFLSVLEPTSAQQ